MIYVGKADEKKQYCTPQLVKISDDKFMLLWTEKHYNATIEIWNDCIFVNDEKYKFSELNKVIKYIRETVKKLNK